MKELKHLEDWLGKEINTFKPYGVLNTLSKEIIFEKKQDFFGLHYNKVRYSIDDLDKINLISLIFPYLLDNQILENLINHYGNPTHMVAQDKLIKSRSTKAINKSELGFHQNLSKKVFSTKPVNFEDEPSWISWEKDGFQFNIRQDYTYGASHIMYKLAKDRF